MLFFLMKLGNLYPEIDKKISVVMKGGGGGGGLGSTQEALRGYWQDCIVLWKCDQIFYSKKKTLFPFDCEM